MEIYLAARFSRAAEMRDVRDFLHEKGHHVTSRWIDLREGDYPEYTTETLNSDPELFASYADTDIEDVQAADILVSFTGQGGKGGRHVEFGLALAQGKRLILVGPREHVFHTLPQVEACSGLDDLLKIL